MTAVLPTLYVAGGMSGYPGLNLGAFRTAEVRLEGHGYPVLNPGRRKQVEGRSWEDWMILGLGDVFAADGVAVLPNWETSRGARLEVHVALELGKPVLPVKVWLARSKVAVQA